ncbi:hypothetical protein [Streptomyces sp. NPDC051684]|uniref:hypothetical protein n=1 Tax=Streptomyces sp. NPDC051684 TaxID=3365670 RepID=UPI0037B121A1
MRWRGRVHLPERPVRGGIAPELMTQGRHGLIGQIDGELFRIDPKPARSGS